MAKNLEYAAKQKERFESLPEPIQQVVLEVQNMLTYQDEFVAGLTETFNWLMTTLEPVGTLITTIFSGIYTVLETVFTGPLFTQIISTITEVAGVLIEKFGYVAKMLTPIVDQILGIINTMAAYMQETLAPVIKGITDVLTGPEVSGAFNAIVDLIGSVLTLALEVVMVAWDALVIGIEYAKPVFEVVFGVLKTVFETAFEVISLGIPVITELINGIIALFRGDTTNAFDNLGTVASEAWGNIVTAVMTAKDDIGKTIGGIIEEIQVKLGEMVTAALAFGKDIVQGLINGINAKIADVMKAAGNLVDEIKKKLNLGFIFGSPSKVTMEMGEWIGEGMSIGMDKTTRDVLESSQNLVMAARAPMMSATGGGGASSVTNNYNLGVSTTASPTVIVRSYNLMRGSV
jgi:phage-related protein